MIIIGLIPARGGSKGIPRKNIKPLSGKPLIVHSIEHALKSPHITKVVVSSDDDEILDVAKAAGAHPLKRPKEFADDHSKMDEAIAHVLLELEAEGIVADLVVLLQPTSPLRNVETINNAILKFKENFNTFDSLMPLAETSSKLGQINEEGEFVPTYNPGVQRQELGKNYFDCGTIHIFKPQVIKEGKFFGNRMLAFPVSWPESLDIDTLHDFELAEYFLNKNK